MPDSEDEEALLKCATNEGLDKATQRQFLTELHKWDPIRGNRIGSLQGSILSKQLEVASSMRPCEPCVNVRANVSFCSVCC